MRSLNSSSSARFSRRQMLGWIGGAGAACLAPALASCTPDDRRNVTTDAAKSLQMYVLDGGFIDILQWEVFQPGAPAGTHRRVSSPSYLIVHPDGSLIWDTGLGDALVGRAEGLPIADLAVFHVRQTLEDQLRAIGHRPAAIDYLALSHFHSDHVGNVELFPDATLLVQQDEYDAAFSESPCCGFDPSGYQSLRASRVNKLAGDHDVFGDETVVIKSLPGHTPGSQSLLVRLPKTGPVLVSGDLVHSHWNWKHQVVPSLNWNAARSRKSMDEAAKLIADEGATLWVQHDLAQFTRLKSSAAYYD
jgi:N-acyl homoserine lactone hydrolase